MFQDSILRFLDATNSWAQEVVVDKPNTFALNKYPGNPIDCFIFERFCNIEDMESEDDEQYYFSTPDYKIRVKLNRFQTRTILSQFNPLEFSPGKIDLIIKMAWNYSRLVINKKTSEFEPFNDGKYSNSPPVPISGGPPTRVVYIED